MGPHHTRSSFASKCRLYVELYAPEVHDFTVAENGLWLLPEGIAEWDRWRGEDLLNEMAVRQTKAGMKRHADKTLKAARILGRTSINDTGCMVDGLRGNQEPVNWALWLAETEFGGIVFTEQDDMEYLRVCGDEGCYNPRHYDVEYGRPTLRERKVEVNPAYYETLEDGRIKTIWDDMLPSIETSLTAFMEFQRQNYPFVPIAASKLTATGISQVRLHPLTGCWEAWQYYCKPTDNLNWQFDGYGRLYQPSRVREIDKETGEILSRLRRGHWMAHRVVWIATGRNLIDEKVLNHMCSYKRCCNPLHLEQVSSSENNLHGRRVQRAIRQLRSTDKETVETRYFSPKELKPLADEITRLYFKIAAS